MRRMVRLAALAAGAAAVLAAAPLQAGTTVAGWEVGRGKQGACMMTALFDDASEEGVSISLVWNKAEQELGFLASSRHWNGLLERAGDPTTLALTFDGDARYRQWLHEGARFHELGGIEAVIGTWGPEHREALVEAMTQSSQVTLEVGGSDLGAFDLSGAAAAYRELLRCGNRA